MKSLRFVLPVVLMLLAIAALAQSSTQKSDAQKSEGPKSEAQKSFTLLKTLAGSWQGPVKTVPKQDWDDKPVQISLRVTSRGNALMHEMKAAGAPDDPTRYDHPVTMLYLDGERLFLTHYCDAGNRPRMVARTSPDGKTVEFDFVDIAGDLQYGHMQHAVFTAIDENHHTEDWTYMMPGDKPVHAHFDLQRTSTIAAK